MRKSHEFRVLFSHVWLFFDSTTCKILYLWPLVSSFLIKGTGKLDRMFQWILSSGWLCWCLCTLHSKYVLHRHLLSLPTWMLVITELAVFLLEDITAHKQLYMVIGQYKVESRDSLPVTQVTKDNRHWQLPESYLSLPYTPGLSNPGQAACPCTNELYLI